MTDNNRTFRLWLDRQAGRSMAMLTALSGLIVVLMAIGLYWKSRPILASKSPGDLLLSDSWYPLRGQFGFKPFITGSICVTGVAVAIAVPLCLLSAVYLAEYAPRWVRNGSKPLIDLLAGIPSVVYGVWGILVVVPLVVRISARMFDGVCSGYCVLSAGIVLAVMVVPVILHVTVEILRSVPREFREASLSLGATHWQTIKHVILRKAMPGIIAAVVLGLSRAFGETMAVLMVVGNMARIPKSVFSPGYPLPALIANKYGETASDPLYASALLLSALILLVVVLGFNVLARVVLIRVEKLTQ
jgi:phosphate transport system permease protein